MYINFSKIELVDQLKPYTQTYLQIIASCINLQLLIVTLKKIDYVRYASSCNVKSCKSVFSKFGLLDQAKPCSQIYFQIITSCINLQLPIVIWKKSINSDMRHRKTYMYINF